jgi:hypothetical protein
MIGRSRESGKKPPGRAVGTTIRVERLPAPAREPVVFAGFGGLPTKLDNNGENWLAS